MYRGEKASKCTTKMKNWYGSKDEVVKHLPTAQLLFVAAVATTSKSLVLLQRKNERKREMSEALTKKKENIVSYVTIWLEHNSSNKKQKEKERKKEWKKNGIVCIVYERVWRGEHKNHNSNKKSSYLSHIITMLWQNIFSITQKLFIHKKKCVSASPLFPFFIYIH